MPRTQIPFFFFRSSSWRSLVPLSAVRSLVPRRFNFLIFDSALQISARMDGKERCFLRSSGICMNEQANEIAQAHNPCTRGRVQSSGTFLCNGEETTVLTEGGRGRVVEAKQ